MRLPISAEASKSILVDDDASPEVAGYKWRLDQHGYPYRTIRRMVDGCCRKGRLMLHRLVAGASVGQVVDHINGDVLDCRRENLRICTVRENRANVVSSKNRKLGGYKGVSWHSTRGKWFATIRGGIIGLDGRRKTLFLGEFTDPAEAAHAYDKKAREVFGEFAALNFPEEQNG
jgi:hypothetical protein